MAPPTAAAPTTAAALDSPSPTSLTPPRVPKLEVGGCFTESAGVRSTSWGGKWAQVKIQTGDKLAQPHFLSLGNGAKNNTRLTDICEHVTSINVPTFPIASHGGSSP